MLTFVQAIEIANKSIQSVTPAANFSLSPGVTLEDCGILDDSHLSVLIDSVAHTVQEFGHRIPKSHFKFLDRNSTINDVAQIIRAHSLPGDDTSEEPPDPPSPAGDDTFEEPPG